MDIHFDSSAMMREHTHILFFIVIYNLIGHSVGHFLLPALTGSQYSLVKYPTFYMYFGKLLMRNYHMKVDRAKLLISPTGNCYKMCVRLAL